MKLSCFLFVALVLLTGLDAHGQENLYIHPVSPKWMGQCDFVTLKFDDTISTSTYYRLIFKKHKLTYRHKGAVPGLEKYTKNVDGNIEVKNCVDCNIYYTSSNFKKQWGKGRFYNDLLSIAGANFFDISNKEKQHVLDSIVAIKYIKPPRKKLF